MDTKTTKRAGDVGSEVLTQLCSELHVDARRDLVLECYEIEKSLLFEQDREVALSRLQKAVATAIGRDESGHNMTTGGEA